MNNVNRIFSFLFVVCILLILFINISCSGANPVIYNLEWSLQVMQNPTDKSVDEKMLMHILAGDDDGFEEIYELYLINDATQLYWRVTSEEWHEFSVGEQRWIGIYTIQAPKNKKMPRGDYRVLIRDLSGYEDEKKITLNEQVFFYSPAELPKLEYQEQNIYKPYFNIVENEEAKGFLQLFHSSISVDEGHLIEENSLLGENGIIYSIKNDLNIRFKGQLTISFVAYIHNRKSDNLIFSRGPYEIILK